MADIIILLVLIVVIGGAVAYIIKQKKKGVKCIGCPDSGQCSGHCSGMHGAGSSCNCEGGCRSHNQ